MKPTAAALAAIAAIAVTSCTASLTIDETTTTVTAPTSASTTTASPTTTVPTTPAPAEETPADPHARGTLIDAQLVRTTPQPELQALVDQIGLPGFDTVHHGLRWWRLEYWTVDPAGRPTPASGTVIVPDGLTGPAPVVSDQHGTQTLRVPPTDDPMAQEIFAAGLMFATNGAIVVGADYLGFGISDLVHPYYHAASEASAATDMLLAARDASMAMQVEWNGQLFLTGYSQGAHVTMALHRELESRPELGLDVTAAVTMAGAYDLADISVPASLESPATSTPLYLAYALYGLHTAGALAQDLDELFTAPWDTTVPELFDGTVPPEQIVAALPADPADLLTADVHAQLSAGNGPVADVLRANSVTDWTPRAPIRVIHGTDDHDVPVANAHAVVERMTSRGAEVQLVLLDGLDHASASTPAYLDAAAWISTFTDETNP